MEFLHQNVDIGAILQPEVCRQCQCLIFVARKSCNLSTWIPSVLTSRIVKEGVGGARWNL